MIFECLWLLGEGFVGPFLRRRGREERGEENEIKNIQIIKIK